MGRYSFLCYSFCPSLRHLVHTSFSLSCPSLVISSVSCLFLIAQLRPLFFLALFSHPAFSIGPYDRSADHVVIACTRTRPNKHARAQPHRLQTSQPFDNDLVLRRESFSFSCWPKNPPTRLPLGDLHGPAPVAHSIPSNGCNLEIPSELVRPPATQADPYQPPTPFPTGNRLGRHRLCPRNFSSRPLQVFWPFDVRPHFPNRTTTPPSSSAHRRQPRYPDYHISSPCLLPVAPAYDLSLISRRFAVRLTRLYSTALRRHR